MRTSLLAGTAVLGLATILATPRLSAAVEGGAAASAPAPRAHVRLTASRVAIVAPPSATVLFNDPTGGPAAQNRIADHLRRAIDTTPRHGSIRMAAYSFDRPDIADALLRACTRRHVSVQVVLNDNTVSLPTRRLQRRLGADAGSGLDACGSEDTDAAPSFVRICHASCRLGDRGNQHMKLYLFSRTADASYLVMLGSANLTGYAARVHWNDLVTLSGSRPLYDDFGRVFSQLAADRRVEEPAMSLTDGDVTTNVAPGRPPTPDGDAVAQRLAGVDCHALPGSGIAGRTVIRISMYGWRGPRGLDLARRVAALHRQGCRVQVLLSAAGCDVVTTLLDAGVRVRSASLDVDHDRATGFEDSGWEHFVHEKWMSLDGTWDGRPTRAVWTGSENWSDVSFLNDELVVMIPRASIHDAYVANFDHIWAGYSKAL